MTDLLITGGTIITMDPNRRVIDDGVVAIENDRIVGVAPKSDYQADSPPAETIDATGMVVMPGLIDGHGHAGHGRSRLSEPGRLEVGILLARRFTRKARMNNSGTPRRC